jgi:glycosyltransferase involved in cell wall biosynthesis
MAPGDPLPALRRADVYVHPTYEDGFAYSPMEALACGVPVIVTEDTGMKEHVVEGVNGYIVPTGNWEALLERMEHVLNHPLAATAERPLVNF